MNKLFENIAKIIKEGKDDTKNRKLANNIYSKIVEMPQFYKVNEGVYQVFLDKERLSVVVTFMNESDKKKSPFFNDIGEIELFPIITSNTIKKLENNPEKEQELVQKILKNEKTNLIHEITHSIDNQRFRDWNETGGSSGKKQTSVKQYANTPAEYNAFFQSMASKFEDNYLNEDMMKNFDRFYNGWLTFVNVDKEAEKIYSNLNDDNKNRIIKRLQNMYNDLSNNRNLDEAYDDDEVKVLNRWDDDKKDYAIGLQNLKSWIADVNENAITPIKTTNYDWFSKYIAKYQNHDIFKVISTDKESLKHFSIPEMDPSELIIMVDIDYARMHKGNLTDPENVDRLVDLMNDGVTMRDMPYFIMGEDIVGEGNHRLMALYKMGYKSIPLRIFWK